MSLVGKPATRNCVLVDILLGLGAVVYCKTNLPQTMMAAETNNNVFGRTLNPLNLGLTSGGSSGGEGALLALKGSILGVGSDFGASDAAVESNTLLTKPSQEARSECLRSAVACTDFVRRLAECRTLAPATSSSALRASSRRWDRWRGASARLRSS